jgi:hypothetical protein
MMTPEGSPLGKPTHYPERDDPALLFPIARSGQREALGSSARFRSAASICGPPTRSPGSTRAASRKSPSGVSAFPQNRHDLLVAESALAHGLLACQGAIFPEINGPKNQLRSLTR